MKNSEAIIKDSMRILTNRMDLVVEDGTPEYEVIIEELDLIDQKKKNPNISEQAENWGTIERQTYELMNHGYR